MSRVLSQSINIVASQRHGHNNKDSVKPRSVRMMYAIRTAAPRLRTLNSLESMLTPGQDFHAKVFTQIGTNRAKGGCSRRRRFVTKVMFERYTDKAIKVILLAQEEARRLGHNFVGTEQILLGLIGESTGIASKVLKSMGISLKDARMEVEKIIGRGSGFVSVEIPFTPRAKRVLELTLEEARHLGKK